MKLQQLLGLAILILGTDELSATELYNLDFKAPEVGTYVTVFGQPKIEPVVGSFNYAMVFRPAATYEQISLPIDVAAPVYEVQFDLFTHRLRDSTQVFTCFLDTPQVRSFNFHPLPNSIMMPYLGLVTPFSDDQVYHLKIVADFPNNSLALTIDDAKTYETRLNAPGLVSIRFNIMPWGGGSGDASSTYVALDNVRVTAVPEPTGTSLLVVTLLVIAPMSRALFKSARINETDQEPLDDGHQRVIGRLGAGFAPLLRPAAARGERLADELAEGEAGHLLVLAAGLGGGRGGRSGGSGQVDAQSSMSIR